LYDPAVRQVGRHCTALHCTALHRRNTALHCTEETMHCTALHCTAVKHSRLKNGSKS